MVIAVQMPLEQACAPEFVDRGGRYSELAGYLFSREHATLTQSLGPALQAIDDAYMRDLLYREGFAEPVAVIELIEPFGDTSVRQGFEQLVDELNDLRQCTANASDGLWPVDEECLSTSAAPADIDGGLRTPNERHVLDQ